MWFLLLLMPVRAWLATKAPPSESLRCRCDVARSGKPPNRAGGRRVHTLHSAVSVDLSWFRGSLSNESNQFVRFRGPVGNIDFLLVVDNP